MGYPVLTQSFIWVTFYSPRAISGCVAILLDGAIIVVEGTQPICIDIEMK